MAKLSTDNLLLLLGSGMIQPIIVELADDEELRGASWTVTNGDKAPLPVRLVGLNAKSRYDGVRIEIDSDGSAIRFLPGDTPTHSLIHVSVKVTIKTKSGVLTTTLGATVRFADQWGGYARAMYPYPANYEVHWDSDAAGQRAIALMHELIGQMPEELRVAAGSMPIVRTKDDSGARGTVRGKTVPIFQDAVFIADALVQQLAVFPAGSAAGDLQTADIEFVKVVLHELVHAATYRKALWNAHQLIVQTRRDMRKESTYYQVVAGVAIGMVFTMTAIRKLLMPDDLIGEWSAITGWELGPVAASIIAAGDVATGKVIWDIGNYLWRVPGEGLLQKNPIRPNLVTGFQPLAGWLGLHIEGGTVWPLLAPFTAASTDLQAKYDAANKALPADAAARQKEWDAARTVYLASKAALEPALVADGIVSTYAATDPIEEIPETAVYLLFNRAQLIREGEYVTLPPDHPKLRAKHKFFVDQGLFPDGTLPEIEVGRFWQGSDKDHHLDQWTVQL
ncbi:hypothetical protein U1839_01000 [Sphingomonas sp. RT2P30]|uniref:hypothetical protein n=1 Tax=Parasphingomonas halimpatiens TaxID=3096162 RepID=UPI002FC9BB34